MSLPSCCSAIFPCLRYLSSYLPFWNNQTAPFTEQGTKYSKRAVSAYTESNHGPDGMLFLDPYFRPSLQMLDGKKILDAGCGAAPWSIYAAMNGGDVYAIDLQEGMIQAAKKSIHAAHLIDKVTVTQGSVAKLPYEKAFFDKAISICVCCNLPPDIFEKHISEFSRTLKKDGEAIIGAPSSLDVVFTDGSITNSEVSFTIQKALDQLPDFPNSELVLDKLNQLTGVLSATFYLKNGRITLVTNEKDLIAGEKIWRKLPKLVVPNFYYSKEHYITMFKKHGFDVEKTDLPHFKNESERTSYNETVPPHLRLGSEYILHPSFVIFHIKEI